jgi:hypothetical protein
MTMKLEFFEDIEKVVERAGLAVVDSIIRTQCANVKR